MKIDKYAKCEKINSSIKRKPHNLHIGDLVYIKNNRKKSKYQTRFCEEPWEIIKLTTTGVTIHNCNFTKEKIRHVDVKPYPRNHAVPNTCQTEDGSLHNSTPR